MKNNRFKNTVGILLTKAALFLTIMLMPKDIHAASDRLLPPNGGEVVISDQECTVMVQDYNWISYIAVKDGYLKLTFSNNTKSKRLVNSFGEVCFYNSEKRVALSALMHYDTAETRDFMRSEYYGVKKGATYKIRIKSMGGVKIHASFKAINKKLNKNLKKKKAVSLKKKKQVNGIIQSGDRKSHFYKFRVTKRQNVKFIIEPYLTDDFYFIISGPGLKRRKIQVAGRSFNGKRVYQNYWGKKRILEISNKALPGTYYMEVKPIGRTCGGYYKISWK